MSAPPPAEAEAGWRKRTRSRPWSAPAYPPRHNRAGRGGAARRGAEVPSAEALEELARVSSLEGREPLWLTSLQPMPSGCMDGRKPGNIIFRNREETQPEKWVMLTQPGRFVDEAALAATVMQNELQSEVAGLALGQAAVSRRMAGPWGAEQAAEFVSGMGPKSRANSSHSASGSSNRPSTASASSPYWRGQKPASRTWSAAALVSGGKGARWSVSKSVNYGYPLRPAVLHTGRKTVPCGRPCFGSSQAKFWTLPR